MDTITAALCETCPDADAAVWPSGIGCAKAQGADFTKTASTLEFSEILLESLASVPGNETADAEVRLLLPCASGEKPAQDRPDNIIKMQLAGPGTNEADGAAFAVVFPVAFGNADQVFPDGEKTGAALPEAQSRPDPEFLFSGYRDPETAPVNSSNMEFPTISKPFRQVSSPEVRFAASPSSDLPDQVFQEAPVPNLLSDQPPPPEILDGTVNRMEKTVKPVEKYVAGKDFQEEHRIAQTRTEAERETAPSADKMKAEGKNEVLADHKPPEGRTIGGRAPGGDSSGKAPALTEKMTAPQEGGKEKRFFNFSSDMASKTENSSEAISGKQPQRSRQSLFPGYRIVETAPANSSDAEAQTVKHPFQPVFLLETRFATSPAHEFPDRSFRETHVTHFVDARPESPEIPAGKVRRMEITDFAAKQPLKESEAARSGSSTIPENSSVVRFASAENSSAAREQQSLSARTETRGEDAELFTEKTEAKGASGEQNRMTLSHREANTETAAAFRKMKAEGRETVTADPKSPPDKTMHSPALIGISGGKVPAAGNLTGQIIRRVAAQFHEKMNGAGEGGRVKIILTPPSLGMLQMDITVTNSLVRVKLTADNKDAGQALAGNIDALKAALQHQGLTIDRCDVLMQDKADSHAQGFRQQSFSREGSFQDNSNDFRRNAADDHLQNLTKNAGAENRPGTGHPSPGNISLFI